MKRTTILAAVVMACLFETSAAAQTRSPGGKWIAASGNFEVAIAPCGRVMCGTVSRVIANRSMAASGSPAALLPEGYRIITDLRPDGDAYRGRIFNRENGRTYDCTLKVGADGSLEVRPYVVLPLFGRSQLWRRVHG